MTATTTTAAGERIFTGGQRQGERHAEGAVGNSGKGSLSIEILNIETWVLEKHMERIANVCREGGFSDPYGRLSAVNVERVTHSRVINGLFEPGKEKRHLKVPQSSSVSRVNTQRRSYNYTSYATLADVHAYW